jgi:putative ABC transport system permease protein
MKALDRKLLRDLLAMRGQALAIAAVIACGIAAFVMALTTLASLRDTRSGYYARQQFAQVFAHLKRAPDPLAARIAEIPGVARVQTRVLMDVTLDIPHMSEPASGRLLSVPDQPGSGLNQLYLRSGRWLDPSRDAEVLVSESFATARNLKPGDLFHAVINGRSRALRIAGTALSPEYIYEIRPGELLPDPKRFGVFWMRHHELAQISGMDGAFNDVSLTLMRGASEPQVLDQLDLLLAPWGGIGSYGREDQLSFRMVSDEMNQLRGMASIVPGIFLLVAAFLLNVVLARIISTQREQIAAIRAFGYSGRELGWHYAKLAGTISLLGVALGCGAGAWLGKSMTVMYGKFFHFPIIDYRFDPPVVLSAIAISLTATGLGVWSAVRQAARLPPAEAMRPETPPNFRAALIERFPILRSLSQSGRMTLRNLAKRPLRTAFSVIGIALAVSVLILGTFTEDIVNEVMDRQFQVAQRQDYTLTLMEPGGPAAIAAVSLLPGVRRAEPFRSVPVRIRSAWRSRQINLTGHSTHRQLYPVLDMDLNAVPLEENTLALSQSLAQILRVQPGDTVDVETMEGRRRKESLTVTHLVKDITGMTALMHIESVWRLLGEGPSISGAFLSADTTLRPRLDRAIKDAPRIAAITSRHALLDSFRNTMAENLLRMKFFNVLFSSIIAFGVVYNTARIAVAERSREFATLRVLGFTRIEVSRLMLIEVGLITAIGLPIGLALGRLLAAFVVTALATESLRLPLVIHTSTYAFAITIIAAASTLSAFIVRRKLDHLNLIAVLKARD